MSDKIRKRGGKAATVEDENESSPAVILDDQEQEQIVKEIKQEAKKANNLVQIVLCVFTGAAMLGAYLLPTLHFSLPPFVSFLLTLRPLLPGLSTPASLQTPIPRIISTLLLAIGPVEKIHVVGGWDFLDLKKSGVSFGGEIVPIIVSVLAGFVEWWMRNLDKDIAGLEKKKYAAKGV
ncbi:hypothetical protein BDY24DRAFT_178631 [Mrakia frigida]|uniref:uncharacterized protein n=1 Tax=Mrakia frigida TaxID=29902 RepID=UPI003FCC1480